MLNVSLDYQRASFHLDLQFQAVSGQTTVLLGESGAGKSTVLHLLAGLQTPQQGLITLNNTPFYDSARRINIPPQQRPIGYVFQDYVLFPHLTVFENVAFGLRAQGLPRRHITTRVGETLEIVQITELAQRMPAQLSGGQQQRAALARALVLRPQLLLLDEPLAALDIQTRRKVRQELRRILQATRLTTIMVTHHYLDSLLFGEQVIVLDAGRIVQQGGQQELREQPRSSYVAELIGVNFLQGQLIHIALDTTCTIRLTQVENTQQPALSIIATLKEADTPDSAQLPLDAYLVIDPRSITLHTTLPDGSARNILNGSIQHIVPLSNSSSTHHGYARISIAVAQLSTPLIAEVTAASVARLDLREGMPIYASFKALEAQAYT